MFASPAIPARPGILVGRPAAEIEAVDAARASMRPRPTAPWGRGHLSFRGTRIFTGLMLGWAGLIVLSFGSLAVPAANDLGLASADPGLMHLLGSIAPWLAAFGIVQLVAGVGITRDRGWGYRLGTWALAIGTFVVLAGTVLALAGRDPFAIADPASPPVANGVALFAWTLGLYGLVGWGVRRILAARALISADRPVAARRRS